jgi:tRNA(Ile)-lysidine synthase TilS/MesJ
MRRTLPRIYNKKIIRAIKEFDLIHPGDKILIGFSGGKDSALLLFGLAILREHGIIEADLEALTIDLGFARQLDPEPLAGFCRDLGVKFNYVKKNIASIVRNDDNPCARCAHFRRGAMNNFARENGFQKVALAHHHDDAVETFLMSIIYSGQIKTFLPKTYLERSGLTVIRPLVYLREREVKKAQEFHGYTPVPKICPYDGNSYRQKTKELIRELVRDRRWVYSNLAAAMREGRPIELWPPQEKVGLKVAAKRKNLLKMGEEI